MKTIIAGNWKMNKNIKETKEFFNELNELVKETKAQVVIAAPFVYLETAIKSNKNKKFVSISSQDVSSHDKGAYTGEVSANMLSDLGVKYSIIGHSERRTYHKESNTLINKKVLKALESNIKPILCVGETLSERESGKVFSVLKTQVSRGLSNVKPQDSENIVIAYEPVWAIGTGKTASPEMAEEVHAYIRDLLVKKYGKKRGIEIPILYGGSMNVKNAKDLLKQKNINGGLIGGASLDAKSFSEIIKFVK